jgi:phosphate transport system substrate-binding protein
VTPKNRWLRATNTFIVLGVVVGSLTQGVAAQAATYTPITGTGSTWSQNALDQWRTNVASNYGMTVNYSGTGSSAGRKDYIAGTVDFAISEIPFQTNPEDRSAPEVPTRGFAYMPIVAGGTSLMYNLKIAGVQVTNLQLSGEVVTKIFTGGIKKWNDPGIKADNPDLSLPDKTIVPVVRSDGSGSTAQFTLWMSKQFSSLWGAFFPSGGLTSQFPAQSLPGSKAQSGSSGVSGYVSQDYGEGAITYVEYSYAMNSGFPVASIKNASGAYVQPSPGNVAVALQAAQINETPGPDYLTQILDGVYNNADANAYPLSSYSYMIVPTEVGGIFNTDKGRTLGTFANYFLCDGQAQAGALGYSPLPKNLIEAAFKQMAKIPGIEATSLDAASCASLTGQDLASQAAAGANTAGTDATRAAAAATAAGAAANAGTAGKAATGVYDANGALISGSTSGGALAVGSPFTLAETGWGASQSTMLFAGFLLVAAAVLPPLFWSRLKLRTSSKKVSE